MHHKSLLPIGFYFFLIGLILIISCKKKEVEPDKTCTAIVYSDIQPDVLIRCPNVNEIVTDSTMSYTFDFNSDTKADIEITCYSHFVFGSTNGKNISQKIIITAIDSGYSVNYKYNNIQSSFTGFLSFNTNIDNSLKWTKSSLLYNSEVSSYNQNVSGKYLPLKLFINKETYYGWIQIDKKGNAITIKDFAYKFCSGKSISAGQKY